MLRHIDDDGFADGLPALRCAAAARQYGHAFVSGDIDDRVHIMCIARNDNARRFDLIMRGVGGVAPTGKSIELLARIWFTNAEAAREREPSTVYPCQCTLLADLPVAPCA